MGKHLTDGLLQRSWCDWFANAAILIKTKQDKKRGTISNSIVITAKKRKKGTYHAHPCVLNFPLWSIICRHCDNRNTSIVTEDGVFLGVSDVSRSF